MQLYQKGFSQQVHTSNGLIWNVCHDANICCPVSNFLDSGQIESPGSTSRGLNDADGHAINNTEYVIKWAVNTTHPTDDTLYTTENAPGNDVHGWKSTKATLSGQCYERSERRCSW